MMNTKQGLMAAALVALTAAGAHASLQVSYTESLGPTLTNISTTLDLPQFDPALGTLLGVEVEYSVNASTSWTATWTGDNPSPTSTFSYGFQWIASIGNADGGVSGQVNSPDGSDPFDFGTWGSFVVPGGVAPGEPIVFDNTDWFIDLDGGFTLTEGFGAYVGQGTVGFDVDVDVLVGFGSTGGNWSSQVSTFGDGSVTITYTYIPTPGAVALFGLAGLGTARRRR